MVRNNGRNNKPRERPYYSTLFLRKIDKKVKEEFKAACASKGRFAYKVIEELMKRFSKSK